MRYHGNLKSTNCVIDNHWACKLTDFGMEPLRFGQTLEEHVQEEDEYSSMYKHFTNEMISNSFKQNGCLYCETV